MRNQKRKDAKKPDVETATVEVLSDAELELLEEVNALNHCGYRATEIVEMLGERWPQAESALRKAAEGNELW
jgi:hypothetical protein